MVNVNLKRSEDTIIALNFSPKNVKVPQIKQAISKFINKKKEIDETDRFNLVLFRGNPQYLEDFTFNKDYLLGLIDDDPKNFNPINIENFIFMALTFLIEVFKRVGNKFFRIIILTDQDMKPIERLFMVEDLMNMTRDMPVFVDIVRLNVREDKDPERENLETLISWSKGGELRYVPKPKKQLEAVMLELAEKKYNESDDAFAEVEELKIDPQYASFYENIALDLEEIDDQDHLKCMACFGEGDLLQCPSCQNAKMHENCWAFWSQSSNIGVRNVFRCPICFTLLKLPMEKIVEVLGEEVKEEDIEETVQNVVVSDQNELLLEKDKEAPKLIESLLDKFI